jgi:hypothetical protein
LGRGKKESDHRGQTDTGQGKAETIGKTYENNQHVYSLLLTRLPALWRAGGKLRKETAHGQIHVLPFIFNVTVTPKDVRNQES